MTDSTPMNEEILFEDNRFIFKIVWIGFYNQKTANDALVSLWAYIEHELFSNSNNNIKDYVCSYHSNSDGTSEFIICNEQNKNEEIINGIVQLIKSYNRVNVLYLFHIGHTFNWALKNNYENISSEDWITLYRHINTDDENAIITQVAKKNQFYYPNLEIVSASISSTHGCIITKESMQYQVYVKMNMDNEVIHLARLWGWFTKDKVVEICGVTYIELINL